MNRGSADEASATVKFGADDFMATWMGAKHRISGRTLGVGGGTRRWPWLLVEGRGLGPAWKGRLAIRAANSGRTSRVGLMEAPRTQGEMDIVNQLIGEPRPFGNLCPTPHLGVGFALVKRNRGAPGIGGVRIGDFGARLGGGAGSPH